MFSYVFRIYKALELVFEFILLLKILNRVQMC